MHLLVKIFSAFAFLSLVDSANSSELEIERYLIDHLFHNDAEINLDRCKLNIVLSGTAACRAGSTGEGRTVITDRISLSEVVPEVSLRAAPSGVPATSLTFRFEEGEPLVSATETRLCDSFSSQRYTPHLAYVLLLDGEDHRTFSQDLQTYISNTCNWR